MEDVYTYNNITVELPVKLIKLEKFSISQKFNEHGAACIIGLIEEQNILSVVQKMNVDEISRILLNDKVIFCGKPTKISIHHIGGIYEMQIKLTDMSASLDQQKKRRSFQNVKESYEIIMKKAVREQSCKINVLKYEEAYPKAPVIQYDETDWEFIKRIASWLNTYILSESQYENINLLVGTYDTDVETLDENNYTIIKRPEQRLKMKGNRLDLSLFDTISYEVQSKNNYNMGTTVLFQNEEYVIAQKQAELIEGIIVFFYALHKKEGTKCVPFYNKSITGAGIEGTILEIVDGYKLKLKLDIDESQEVSDAFPFDFAVPFTCESNTGWYAMPEVGERVILYVPTKDEQSAYVVKVIQKEGIESIYTMDPKAKYFGVPGDSELTIRKNEMLFNVTDEQLYVWMSDKNGVIMHSNEDIQLTAGVNGILQCNQFIAEAKGKVNLYNDKSSIIVDKKVHFYSKHSSQNPIKINLVKR